MKKKRNPTPSDEARLINAAGDRPIDHLDSRTLNRHLDNIFLFKLGLRNSFGIDFRTHTHRPTGSGTNAKPVLFNYLSEIVPFIESRVKQLPPPRQRVYAQFEERALESFWEIYYRFQPLIHKYAKYHGVEVDDLGNVLGRAILLFEKERGFKFYSYLQKTLHTSIKNLRGRVYAEKYMLPLSAGRLMPQLLWMLDQETLRRERRLTTDESDHLVIDFLRKQTAQFSEATMRDIARVARTQLRQISLDGEMASNSGRRELDAGVFPTGPGEHDFAREPSDIEQQDEFEHLLRRIHLAIDKAGFDPCEQALILQRLNLSYDEGLYTRMEEELSAGSMRNRKMRLLVRFMAALHADDAPEFGRFLNAEPEASRTILQNAIHCLATQNGKTMELVVQQLMNLMSLTDSVYKLSISERGRLSQFLLQNPVEGASARTLRIDGHVYHKLKAALMEQESRGFPFLDDATDESLASG